MIETFEEFISERYAPLEIKFLERTSRHLSKNFLSMRKFCLEEWRKAISAAVKIQREEEKICAYMSVSLLNTSVAENFPKLQIDFYNEEWVYGESFSRSKMDADFLFTHWKDFTLDALDENFYLRSNFGETEIKSLFFGTVDKLAFMFACFAKYFACQLEYSSEFDDLVKAENFYFTCGTYLDWQNRIFAELPEIDLLNPDANEQTQFRPVKNKILRGQSFRGIDMRGCYFEDCLFQNFSFEDVSIVDARFLRCRFISVTFENVRCAGTNFFECYFKDCTFQNCSSNPADVAENNDEYFMPMNFYHCFVLESQITDCDFEQMKVTNIYTKE